MTARSKKRSQPPQRTVASREPRAGSGGLKTLAAIGALITLATVLIYWHGLPNDFVYDDTDYVTENRYVKAGLTGPTIAWAFAAMHSGNWHPLTWLSHALDCQLYGLNPVGHHLTSLLLHIANALLLLCALYRMTGSVWKSGFAAALFAVHPLRVESVAWAAERKDVLSAFFWLMAILAYSVYTGRPNMKRYLLVVLAFALGLMSKPMTVSLPVTLLILDYWPLNRLKSDKGLRAWWPLVREKLPLFAFSAASSVITFIAQRKGGAVALVEDYPFGGRVANALVSYAKYLTKTVWPDGLAAHYPYNKHLPLWQVAAAALLLAVVTAFVARLSRRFRYLGAGWAWYVLTMVPVIGIVQVGAQAMADRYTYIPLIGIYVIAAWGTADLLSGLAPRSRALRHVAVLCAVVVLLAYSGAAWRQVGYWRNAMTLWQHALDVTTNNARAHYNLGNELQEQGKWAEAEREYVQAIRIRPNYAQARNNLGNALSKQGKLDEAAEQFREVTKLWPHKPDGYVNLGTVLKKQGKSDEALAAWREALRLKPDYPLIHYCVANILAKQGRLDEAIEEYNTAIRQKPDYGDAYSNLAIVMFNKGDYAAAWKNVHLSRKYGYQPPAALLQALSQKMPDPGM